MLPGRGRTLGSGQSQAGNSNANLQARLLDNSSPDQLSGLAGVSAEGRTSDDRRQIVDNAVTIAPGGRAHNQGSVAYEEQIQKLVSMGFEKTQVKVALAVANGDLNVAVEILMSQQG